MLFVIMLSVVVPILRYDEINLAVNTKVNTNVYREIVYLFHMWTKNDVIQGAG